MIAVDGWLGARDDVHMLMQVHDELVFEIRADVFDALRAGIAERMQGAAELSVPLVVDVGVGTNWDQAH
jgi:DNA polymerase-1